jgi:hypothetical protein
VEKLRIVHRSQPARRSKRSAKAGSPLSFTEEP